MVVRSGLMLILVAGCAHYRPRPVGAPLGYPEWPKQTADWQYNGYTMGATRSIANSVVQSEATLRISDAGACAHVEMRMHAAYDQPTSKYGFACETEDGELPAHVGPESEPETRDYEFLRDGGSIQLAKPGLAISAPVGKPEAHLFRIVERKIVAC